MNTLTNEFEEWLAGFMEGDGTIMYYRQPNADGNKTHPMLEVNFAQKDTSVLNYIHDTVGYGSQHLKREGTTTLNIRGLTRSIPILEVIARHVVTEHTQERLLYPIKELNLNIPVQLHEPTLDWLVGFWDAEGTSQIGTTLQLHIWQKDANVFSKVSKLLGYGSVSMHVNRSGSDMYILTVSSERAYELSLILLKKSHCSEKRERLRVNVATYTTRKYIRLHPEIIVTLKSKL